MKRSNISAWLCSMVLVYGVMLAGCSKPAEEAPPPPAAAPSPAKEAGSTPATSPSPMSEKGQFGPVIDDKGK